MDNVWNIRKKENLYYILPDDYVKDVSIDKVFSNTVIIVYLYYEDSVENYFRYLNEIPPEIKVYIISSNKQTLEAIRKYASDKGNITVMQKKNRGRDVSALLITARDIFLKYDYACFVHDKKGKKVSDINDVNLWIQNLWDNTLKSEAYIKNVLSTLVADDCLGLLVPPEPIGNNMNAWYANSWYKEYYGTVKLADQLGLNSRMDRRYPPITLGTVFWCKTKALKKLFDISWSYDDFQDEPLPEYQSFSYTVERIFAYVAQDVGYKTGIVMTPSYASILFSIVQAKMKDTYDFLKKELGINNYEAILRFEECIAAFQKFAACNIDVYVYGAGLRGQECIRVLKHIGCLPRAVIVTKAGADKETVAGIPIITINELDESKDIGIIVGVGKALNKEITAILDSKGYRNYICYVDI